MNDTLRRSIQPALVAVVLAPLMLGCDKRSDGAPPANRNVQAHADLRNPGSIDSLLSEGESAYQRSEYDTAVILLDRGRRAAEANNDSALASRALTWLGLTAYRQGRYADAKSLGEQALAIKIRLGLKKDLFRSYNALGLLAHDEGRLTESVRLFTMAANAAHAVKDSAGVAKAVGNLGLAHSDLGDFELARREFSTMRDAFHKMGDDRLEGNAFNNLGMLAIRDGDAAAAIPLLQSARSLYRKADYPAGDENALGQLGTAYDALGDPQRAIVYLDSALAIARKHDLKAPEAEDLQLMAEQFGQAGDHQRALQYLSRAKQLSESMGLGSRLGDIAQAESREYAMLSRADLALSRARQASSAHHAAHARLEELNDQLLIAEIAQTYGRRDEAATALDSSAVLARTLSQEIAAGTLALGRARVDDAAGNFAGVLNDLAQSHATIARLGPQAEWQMHAMEARSFARLGRWPEAVLAGRRAVSTIENIRGRLGESSLRTSFINDRSDVYAQLVVALLAQGRTSEAFEVADAARGKALLEHLGALSHLVPPASRHLSESERLLRRIDWLLTQLHQADTVPARERSLVMRDDLRELSRRLLEARQEYEDHMKKAAVIDPRGAALIGNARTSTPMVLASLHSDEVLIEYLATADRLVTFIANRNGVRALTAEMTYDDLATRIRLATELLSRREGDLRAHRSVLNALYRSLLLPIEKTGLLRNARTIIVVPHAMLSSLPFAALVDDRGKYVVEDFAFLSLPSAASLPVLRRDDSRRRSSGTSVLAPFPTGLPGTRAEAVEVSRSLGAGQTFLGPRATESALRAALGRSSIVHVASHAILNSVSPMFSRIELAQSATSSPADDGRLEVHELLGIPVESRLVFLSGCETGAGIAGSTSFRRGQDYATLSQAFLYAGARDVVATLWKIDDERGAVFASRFYSELANSTAVEALAATQRIMIHDAALSRPRYWAGYVLSGSGGLSPSKSQTRRLVSVQ
jgi:CHAT domain-containing protein